MIKFLNNLVEGIVGLILATISLTYGLIMLALFIALIVSPFMLIGFIVWAITQ